MSELRNDRNGRKTPTKIICYTGPCTVQARSVRPHLRSDGLQARPPPCPPTLNVLVPVVPHPAFIPIPKPNYNHPLIAIAYIYMRRAPRKARRRPAQPPGGPTWAQPYRMRGPFGTHNIQHTACTHIEVVSQVALAIDKLCLLLSARRTHAHFVGSVRPHTLNERVAYIWASILLRASPSHYSSQ